MSLMSILAVEGADKFREHIYIVPHIPVIVAHRVNDLEVIKYLIKSGVSDVIEIDVAYDPTIDTLVLDHINEEEYLRNQHIIRELNEGLVHDNLRRRHNKIMGARSRTSHSRYLLGEVLETIANLLKHSDYNVSLMIDLKTYDAIDLLLKFLQKYLDVIPMYVCSKYHNVLLEIKKREPRITTLASLEERVIDISDYLSRIRADGISIRAAYVDKGLINELKEKGYIVAVWVVNDLYWAEYLFKLGVDFIITDIPSELKLYMTSLSFRMRSMTVSYSNI